MINLTRLNGTEILLNDNFIEIVEETPDTIVTLQNGHRIVVRETMEEISKRMKPDYVHSYNKKEDIG